MMDYLKLRAPLHTYNLLYCFQIVALIVAALEVKDHHLPDAGGWILVSWLLTILMTMIHDGAVKQ